MLPILFSSIFFAAVLKFTSWHIPILNLCLLGITFGLLTSFIIVFFTFYSSYLPHCQSCRQTSWDCCDSSPHSDFSWSPSRVTLLWFGTLPFPAAPCNLSQAYDVQRGPNVEMMLCLLPPSAGLMIIKLLCSLEAYHTPLLWTTTAIVSNVPLYTYTLVLVFDFFLYYLIALFFAWNQFRIKEKLFLRPNDPSNSSDSHHYISPHRSFLSRNWLNMTKLGIPFRFQHFTQSYSQIPDADLEGVLGEAHTIEESPVDLIAVLVSSLCKSYETIEGSPIEVLKNVCGELTKGSITTLLGR